MAISTQNNPRDVHLEQFHQALDRYTEWHPRANVLCYRRDPFSIRVRIVDPAFQDLEKPERHAMAWHYLEELPEIVLNDLTMLLLLTPEEVPASMENIEFEEKSPWRNDRKPPNAR